MDANQNPAVSFEEAVLKAKVAQICDSAGFHAITQDSSNILVDIYRRTIHHLARHCKDAANNNQRVEPTMIDLIQAYDFVGISIPSLKEYIETVQLPFNVEIVQDKQKPSNRIQRNLLVDDLLEAEKNTHLEDQDDLDNKASSEADEDDKLNVPLLKDTYEQIASKFTDCDPVIADKKIRLSGRILVVDNTKLKISAPLPPEPIPSTSGGDSSKLGKKKKKKEAEKTKVGKVTAPSPVKQTKGKGRERVKGKRKKKLSREFVLPEQSPKKEQDIAKELIAKAVEEDERKKEQEPEPELMPELEPEPQPVHELEPEPVLEKEKDKEKEKVKVKAKTKDKEKIKGNKKAPKQKTKAVTPLDPSIAEPPTFFPLEEDVNPTHTSPAGSGITQDDLCPECGLPDDGTIMIQCDNPFCAKWFHCKCVNLVEEPNENESWFCKACVDKQARKSAHLEDQDRLDNKASFEADDDDKFCGPSMNDKYEETASSFVDSDLITADKKVRLSGRILVVDNTKLKISAPLPPEPIPSTSGGDSSKLGKKKKKKEAEKTKVGKVATPPPVKQTKGKSKDKGKGEKKKKLSREFVLPDQSPKLEQEPAKESIEKLIEEDERFKEQELESQPAQSFEPALEKEKDKEKEKVKVKAKTKDKEKIKGNKKAPKQKTKAVTPLDPSIAEPPTFFPLEEDVNPTHASPVGGGVAQDDLCPECSLPDDGTMMIQCDDPFCAKWFHCKCVNLVEEPNENESWFCKVCVDKQQSAFKRRRRPK